jgi:NitT/TauT family transport system permease protein
LNITRIMKRLLANTLPPLVIFIVLVLLAEGIVRAMGVPGYLVPRPSAVGQVIWEDHAELLGSLWTTAQAALIGFGASAIIGLLIALLLSTSRLVQRAFYPYTVFFQTVPVIAIAPLLVIWFGAGLKSVATCAFIVSVFPVIANSLTGLLSVEPPLRDMFRLYGASPAATLWKLKLPGALPHIFTGLRIAAGLAVIGTIVGEFVAGLLEENPGLGILVVEAKKMGRTDLVFASVLAASVLGLLMLAAINFAAWLALRRWHASEQG